MTDYLLWYAKNINSVKVRQLYKPLEVKDDTHWSWIEMPNETRRKMSKGERTGEVALPLSSRKFQLISLYPPSFSPMSVFPIVVEGEEFIPRKGACWITNPAGFEKLRISKKLMKEGDVLRYVLHENDFPFTKLTAIWLDTQGAPDKIYAVQTDHKVIARCLLMTTDPGDLVLDPTCGSGTTAYVAEQWGRRWITCDTSRVALALARTRLMSAKYSYYLVADSPEGIQKEAELTGKMPPEYRTGNDIKRGFVYKRVPHVKLKSIANNPDIKEGMTREEIDAAIARHAETETLYDQPYEDNKRVRVAGPFTVESLSPHRVLSTADDDRDGMVSEEEARKQQDFAAMILENLKKAGLQNTRKGERLNFDRL